MPVDVRLQYLGPRRYNKCLLYWNSFSVSMEAFVGNKQWFAMTEQVRCNILEVQLQELSEWI